MFGHDKAKNREQLLFPIMEVTQKNIWQIGILVNDIF